MRALARFRRFALLLFYRTPIDGAGIIRLGPPASRRLGRVLPRGRWADVPAWCRPVAIASARLLLLVVCPIHVVLAVRSSRTPVSWRTALGALWRGWTRGKSVWLFFEAYPSIGTTGPTESRRRMIEDGLDERQGGLLLNAIGRLRDRQLASDKVGASNALAALGLPVAPILAEVSAPDHRIDLSAPPWLAHDKLFIKPRHSFSAHGAMTVARAGHGQFTVGNTVMSQEDVALRLASGVAAWGSMIVQPFLRPAATTWDISRETATWLRIVVYRSPGMPVKHLSSALRILPRGKDVEPESRNVLMAPIDPADGTLRDAIIGNRPDRRFSAVPWNGVTLRGRHVPEWEEATQMVIRGSELFAGLPVIAWDVLLGVDGPVILELNTSVSITIAQLWYFETCA